mgnify:CR=1 FL=1
MLRSWALEGGPEVLPSRTTGASGGPSAGLVLAAIGAGAPGERWVEEVAVAAGVAAGGQEPQAHHRGLLRREEPAHHDLSNPHL